MKTENEERKLAYMFPEYLFLNADFTICLAGRNVEELLNYDYGFLMNKNINILSEENDLKFSLMIQFAQNFFEWRSYSLKSKNMSDVPVEICGFRMPVTQKAISPIAMRVRRSRNHLEKTSSTEVDKLTYWIAHNLRGPLASIEGLINLAKTQEHGPEITTYLQYMSQQAEKLDGKIETMVRMAGKFRK